MRRSLRIVGTLAPMLAVLVASGWTWAGTLVNGDNVAHQFAAHWDDLEEPTEGVIQPGETIELRPVDSTLELVGKRDNIYMAHNETIRIRFGILHRE